MRNTTNFNLKRYRQANRLNQKTLADILGVTQGFISRVESGEAPIPETMIDAILEKTDWEVPADVVMLAEMSEHGDVITQNGGAQNIGKIDGGSTVAVLQERVNMLERLLEEKERTIRILMGQK